MLLAAVAPAAGVSRVFQQMPHAQGAAHLSLGQKNRDNGEISLTKGIGGPVKNQLKRFFAKSDARDALASLGSGMTLSNIGIHY